MFGRLRMALLRRSLQHLVAQPRRQRRPHTLESARSVALLFDASEEETRKVMTLWAESFIEREPRKRLHMLGFIDNEHTVGQTRFPQFTAKELRWYGRINSPAVERFVREAPDLLLCFNPQHRLPIHWVATASAAHMKIGSASQEPNDFDFILEVPADKGGHFFLREVAFYLSKIVPVHHEQPA